MGLNKGYTDLSLWILYGRDAGVDTTLGYFLSERDAEKGFIKYVNECLKATGIRRTVKKIEEAELANTHNLCGHYILRMENIQIVFGQLTEQGTAYSDPEYWGKDFIKQLDIYRQGNK